MRKGNRLNIQKEFLTRELSCAATLEVKVKKKAEDVQWRVITQSQSRAPGDHSSALPGMGTNPPLGVTWEQWVYEYVWDYCSLWAEVTAPLPSYVSNFLQWAFVQNGEFGFWSLDSFPLDYLRDLMFGGTLGPDTPRGFLLWVKFPV